MILSSVRNQDVLYFFRYFASNSKARYALREFFENNYDTVNFPYLGTSFLDPVIKL